MDTIIENIPRYILMIIQRKTELIYQLPKVQTVILYGSYAKGNATADSDVDIAVFFDDDKPSFIEEYRSLVKICNNHIIDIQVQAFSAKELADPCGIIEEIVEYGVVINRR